MNPNPIQLRHQPSTLSAKSDQNQQEQGVRQFATVEDLLHEDAASHPPPPEVETRVKESVRLEGITGQTSWWRRWFRSQDQCR